MPLYLGFDCSTQALSVVCLDTVARAVVYRSEVVFEQPFLASEDPAVIHADPRMWVAALAEVLGRLREHVDPTTVAAMSGSAQQHGSVYCGEGPGVLTRDTAPIWMDTSTSRECAEIETALGGADAVAQLTGSRAYPRFTGPQIRKFFHDDPGAYARTQRIHLVSSFMASVLAGRHVAVDYADASGMNLMDIRALAWSPQAVNATAPDLAPRLPPLVASSQFIGTLASGWQHRLGLPPIPIVAWSGDNPCSLVGTGVLDEGQLAISLGTSDTIFGPMSTPRVSANGIGHVFASPLGAYMGITVFRNGSLARERVRDEHAMSWRDFSHALNRTPPGNDGVVMLPWFEPEISPPVLKPPPRGSGPCFNEPERQVRALIEGQAMALARHSRWMGVEPKTIYATGGAAENREILQVIADVFGADVYRFQSTDAAALGAALRAYQADSSLPWQDTIDGFLALEPGFLIRPNAQRVEIYDRLKPVYEAAEQEALRNSE